MSTVDEANRTCEERVFQHLQSRLETLRDLWDLYREDVEAYHPDHGTNMNEFGLSFDYVAPETFENQPEGYFRYQLSWGGPGDEFRIYAQPFGNLSDWRFSTYRIEYWFLDWWDGAHRVLADQDFDLLKEIFESYFVDSETAKYHYDGAMDL